MKKYKHIKTGETVELFVISDKYLDKDGAMIPKRFIEGNSDWEELKEKEYEILSFRLDSNGSILDKHENGKYGLGGGYYTAEDILSGDPKRVDWCIAEKEYGYSIYSIKRLSDGVVFTVGDRISGFTYTDRPLLGIEQDGDSVWFSQKDDANTSIGGTTTLEDAEPYFKTPLLTTVDGKVLFKGDTFWHVDPQLEIGEGLLSIDKFTKLEGYKEFSTKELAKEYVLRNTPCLSLNDLLDVWEADKDFDVVKNSKLFKRFESLAKNICGVEK